MSAIAGLMKIAGAARLVAYRHGDGVAFVALLDATSGQATIVSRSIASWPSVEAYEAERDRYLAAALKERRFALLYPRVKALAARLGFDIDADVRDAPPLPADLRHLLAPALPSIAPRPFGFLGRYNAR